MSCISITDLVDLEQPRDLHISADGKLATYITQATSRKESSPKTTIWLAEIGKENSAKPLTKGDHLDTSPSFSPDGGRIAFLSDRDRNRDGDSKDEDLDLYIVSIPKPDTIEKVNGDAKCGPIGSFKWDHNGKYIALSVRPEKDKSSDVKVYGEKIRYQNLWLLDTGSNQVERLIDETADVRDFDWNRDGSEIVYTTAADTDLDSADRGMELKVVNISAKALELKATTKHSISSVCWSDDGILIRASYNLQGMNRAQAILRLRGDKFENVAFGQTNDAAGLKRASGKSLVLVEEGLRTQVQISAKKFYDVDHHISEYDAVLQEDTPALVTIEDSVGVPPEVYSIVAGKTCRLSSHGEHIAKMEIAKPHMVEYTENGVPYDACYTVPQGRQAAFDAREPQPTAVYVHGGPYGRSTNGWDGLLLAPYLSAKGYLVMSPNYRGGSGHGDDYAFAVDSDPEISYHDVIWLVKKGIEEGRIDKDRVAIVGWSQGGYMAYQAVARDSTFHFTAAMAGAGVSDWYVTAAGSDLTTYESTLLGFVPWIEHVPVEKLHRGNPIRNAKDVHTPLLIIHGEEDGRVSPLNATLFAKALKAHKKDFQMALYPGEGHGSPPKVFERAHYIDWLERMGRFLDKHLKM